MMKRVIVTRDELISKIGDGEIETVVMGFPDRYGRLTGKRATGDFFVQHVADHGAENCDYLLTCDLDYQPVPGFRFSSFDKGYGDMVATADWSTVRVLPWSPKTALVMCDLETPDGQPVEVAPRTVLRRQEEAAASRGFTVMTGSEIEFYVYHDSYDDMLGHGYRRLRSNSNWPQDYNVVQTSRDEGLIGRIRRGLVEAGVPVEFSKGEAGTGQHEINLSYSTPVEMADRNIVYRSGAKEIAAHMDRSITFMAKPNWDDVGSSCHVHVSLWNKDASASVFADDQSSDGTSATFRSFLAGMIATAREFSLLWAPTVNSYKRYQPESWAPTGVGWGTDNRTLGFRVVGHGPSLRIESRIPGADCNSYLAFAGVIAGGLRGIDQGLELPPRFEGNGYQAENLQRIPSNLPDAIALWRDSSAARECFGDDVHHWVLRSAESEWETFNRTVTDWEMFRYFERI